MMKRSNETFKNGDIVQFIDEENMVYGVGGLSQRGAKYDDKYIFIGNSAADSQLVQIIHPAYGAFGVYNYRLTRHWGAKIEELL